MNSETKRILTEIRRLVSSVSKENERELLEELDADHEGWSMRLEEMDEEGDEE